jgi:hypothetical protein
MAQIWQPGLASAAAAVLVSAGAAVVAPTVIAVSLRVCGLVLCPMEARHSILLVVDGNSLGLYCSVRPEKPAGDDLVAAAEDALMVWGCTLSGWVCDTN